MPETTYLLDNTTLDIIWPKTPVYQKTCEAAAAPCSRKGGIDEPDVLPSF